MEPPPAHLLPEEGYKGWTGSFNWTQKNGVKTTVTKYEITKLDGSVLNFNFEKKEVDPDTLSPTDEEHAIAEAQLKAAGVDSTSSVNGKMV